MILLFTLSCISAKYADTGEQVTVENDEQVDTETVEDDTGSADLDCSINWDGWTDGFFATYCRSCHSVTTAERYGAPEGIDFDTRAEVILWAERIRIRVLQQQTMPLGGGVVQSDLAPLDMWLRCKVDQ